MELYSVRIENTSQGTLCGVITGDGKLVADRLFPNLIAARKRYMIVGGDHADQCRLFTIEGEEIVAIENQVLATNSGIRPHFNAEHPEDYYVILKLWDDTVGRIQEILINLEKRRIVGSYEQISEAERGRPAGCFHAKRTKKYEGYVRFSDGKPIRGWYRNTSEIIHTGMGWKFEVPIVSIGKRNLGTRTILISREDITKEK